MHEPWRMLVHTALCLSRAIKGGSYACTVLAWGQCSSDVHYTFASSVAVQHTVLPCHSIGHGPVLFTWLLSSTGLHSMVMVEISAAMLHPMHPILAGLQQYYTSSCEQQAGLASCSCYHGYLKHHHMTRMQCKLWLQSYEQLPCRRQGPSDHLHFSCLCKGSVKTMVMLVCQQSILQVTMICCLQLCYSRESTPSSRPAGLAACSCYRQVVMLM